MSKTCKLIVKDEVNVKFEGLDPRTRSKLINAVQYTLPHARYTPAGRLGRWDGKVSFMTIGGSTYFHVLDKLMPVIDKEGYEITEIEDLRDQREITLSPIDENYFSDVQFAPGHHMEGQSIVLRPHQVECVNACLSNRHGLVVAATGAGKTLITAALSRKVEKYGRSIVIVPSQDLVTQTEEDYKMVGLDVGVFYGGRKELNKTHTICTWQSLNCLWKKTKADDIKLGEQDIFEFINGVACVIVDECLDGDTLIETPLGKKKIKDMNPGDPIYSYDEEAGEFIEDKVVKLHTNLVKSNSARMLEIEMEDGSILKITGNHKVLTKRGWIDAGHLTIEDDIISWK